MRRVVALHAPEEFPKDAHMAREQVQAALRDGVRGRRAERGDEVDAHL